jgi:hypothetical protein
MKLLPIDKEIQDAIDVFTEATERFEKYKAIAAKPDSTAGQKRDMFMHLEDSKTFAYLLAHLVKRKVEEI